MTAEAAPPGDGPSSGQLLGWMTIFVAIGIPMVYFIWEFVNELLLGRFNPGSAITALVFLLLLVVWLRVLARRIRRWDTGSVG